MKRRKFLTFLAMFALLLLLGAGCKAPAREADAEENPETVWTEEQVTESQTEVPAILWRQESEEEVLEEGQWFSQALQEIFGSRSLSQSDFDRISVLEFDYKEETPWFTIYLDTQELEDPREGKLCYSFNVEEEGWDPDSMFSDLKVFKDCRRLSVLSISHVSPGNLKAIKNFPSLRYLILRDAGLENDDVLSYVSNLEYVDLDDNGISDLRYVDSQKQLAYFSAENNILPAHVDVQWDKE